MGKIRACVAISTVVSVAGLAGLAGTSTAASTVGRAAPSADLAAASTGYRDYVESETAKLVTTSTALAAAIRAGNLAKAQELYPTARRHYESIEAVAESFGDLDPDIDAHEGDVSAAKWRGFHKIEKLLWISKSTSAALPFAEQLVTDVTTLKGKIPSLTFSPVELAKGSVDLLNEVANSKITGEEEKFSHTDLNDFQANLVGSRKAFQLLTPALQAYGDTDLVTAITTRFAAVQTALNRYKRPTALGFTYYAAVTASARRSFAQQVDALAEPLSTVAAKV